MVGREMKVSEEESDLGVIMHKSAKPSRQFRIQGANPAMAPIEVGNGVWLPFEGRQNNDSIVKKGHEKFFWEIH